MTTLSQLFLYGPINFGIAAVFFALGMLVKKGIIARQRKRILSLEDEMLSNHSRILALEKKLSNTTVEKNGMVHDYDIRSAGKTDVERKIS